MKRNIIQLYLMLCFMVVGSFLSLVNAQISGSGNGALSEEGGTLTLYNSIVWDNGPGSLSVEGSDNLVDKDPIFASATEFFPLEGSPARGTGDNKHWNDLTGILLVDIAGINHASPMNIGAYESNVKYTVTSTTNVTVYLGTVSVTSGESFPAGTKLKVVANVQPGSKLETLTANGTVIRNGEPFILTGDTEFNATFLPARADVYATMKHGSGKLNVFNTIIYDNVDLFGNYSPDATNMIGNPQFSTRTTFTLQPESQALGNGDGSKLPAGFITDVAGLTFDANGAIDAGAYQTAAYTVSWSTPSNGTLEVFKYEKGATDQWVETPLTSGSIVSVGTIIVRAKATNGYYLKELIYNGVWINTEDEIKDPLKTPLLSEGRFSLISHTTVSAVFASISATDKVAASVVGGTFRNNIVYDNNGLASNLTEADQQNPVNNLLDVDPKFTNQTTFSLQPSSPALNKGNNDVVAVIEKDLAGAIRIQGGMVDMGALESNSGGYIITYNSQLLSKNDMVATVALYDGNTLIESGTQLPAGTVLTVKATILNEHFEQLGRIKLNDGVLDSYIDGTEFTLNANTTVTVQVRAKEYKLSYLGTNAAVMVYSGTTPQASGTKIYYDNYLTVQVLPSQYHELQFVAVNGKHINGAENGNYVVYVDGDITITANAVPLYELDENGDPVLIDDTGDPNDPTNWEPVAEIKGLLTWDTLNATVTATNKADGSPVHAGDLLSAGTVVNVKISPIAASGYKLVLIELNGLEYPYSDFDLTIPEIENGSIASTFIGVRYEKMTDDEESQLPDPTPQPGVNYAVTTSVTGNGTLSVLNGSTPVQSGIKLESGTTVTIEATPATGYRLSSLTVNNRGLLSGSTLTVLEASLISAVFEKESVPSMPPVSTDKKVTITVMGSGSITLQNGITAAMIESGDWVTAGSSVMVTAVAANGYELTSLLVNGLDIKNNPTFTVTENSALVAVFNLKGETPTPPVTPPVPPVNPEIEYVTLTIGGSLPSGITINPSGTQRIEKGSSLTLRLTVDDRHDGKYVFLKLGGTYVMIRSNTDVHSLSYTLVNITGSMSVDIVVTDTPDPDPENPSSNVEIKDDSEIWTESGEVCIRTDIPVTVRIVTFNGRVQVQQNLPAGETRIQLPDGFYIIVLSDGTTKKIAVRNF